MSEEATNELFKEEEDFDSRNRKDHPEAYKGAGGTFAKLDKLASLFVLMPRKEKPSTCYMSVLQHRGLTYFNEAKERKDAAPICLEAAGLGKCPVCFAMRILANSSKPAEKAIYDKIKPKKSIMATVWWVPLSPVVLKLKGAYPVPLTGYDGSRAQFEVLENPSMKTLSFSETTWAGIKSLIMMEGVSKCIGVGASPIYIIGNGEDKMARRYREAKILSNFNPDLLPTTETPLLDLTEAARIPTEEQVALLMESSYPGLLNGFEFTLKTGE